MPSIKHPTDRLNFSIVSFDGVAIAFSYETMIGFSVPGHEWAIRENNWGPTTGKHLNYLDPDKKKRIPYDEFTTLYHERTTRYRREGILASLKLPLVLFDNRKPYADG